MFVGDQHFPATLYILYYAGYSHLLLPNQFELMVVTMMFPWLAMWGIRCTEKSPSIDFSFTACSFCYKPRRTDYTTLERAGLVDFPLDIMFAAGKTYQVTKLTRGFSGLAYSYCASYFLHADISVICMTTDNRSCCTAEPSMYYSIYRHTSF